MDAKIKTKWIKALRSGKYKQAKGVLKDRRGAMCCLGVLADIQGIDWRKISLDDRITAELPKGFGAGVRPLARNILAAKNDGSYCTSDGLMHDRRTFKEIADYIEAKL